MINYQKSVGRDRKAFYSDVGLSGVDSAIASALKPNTIVHEIMPIARSGDSEAVQKKIAEILRPFDPLRRHLVLSEVADQLKAQEKVLLARKAENRHEHEEMTLARDILSELLDWEGKGGSTALQAAMSSRAHELNHAFLAKNVFGVRFPAEGTTIPPLVNFEDAHKGGEIFVVEHDWAAAFAGAGDYDGGEFRLPYDRCVFEFCYGGRRMIMRAQQAPEQAEPEVQAFLELRTARRGGWVCLTAPTDKCYDLVKPAVLQVKAICVSLEAEITYADAIRIPEKLRRARERDGKLPPFDHHVVRLNRRLRTARCEGEHEPGRRKRLHFRRGHWRHYATHRTWIKWTLCGNPHLGFVDKEYRL